MSDVGGRAGAARTFSEVWPFAGLILQPRVRSAPEAVIRSKGQGGCTFRHYTVPPFSPSFELHRNRSALGRNAAPGCSPVAPINAPTVVLAREVGGRFEDTSWLEKQSAGSLSPNSGHKTARCHTTNSYFKKRGFCSQTSPGLRHARGMVSGRDSRVWAARRTAALAAPKPS